MNDETAAVFAWLSKFIATLEDGAIDPDQAIQVLEELATLCEKVATHLSRRWWRWVAAAVACCLREGAEDLRKKQTETETGL